MKDVLKLWLVNILLFSLPMGKLSGILAIAEYQQNKCITIEQPRSSVGNPFRLLANGFLMYCSDLAVLIFSMLLVDI